MVFMLEHLVTQLLCYRHLPCRYHFVCMIFTTVNIVEQSHVIDFQLVKGVFSIDPHYSQIGKIPVFAYYRYKVSVA